VSRLKPKGKNS